MMSLSKLRNSLNSSASPLRLVDVALRCSSTVFSGPPSSFPVLSLSSSITTSANLSARPFNDDDDGEDRSGFERRSWRRRIALGVFLGGGVLLSSASVRRRLDSHLPSALAADGRAGVVLSNATTLADVAGDKDPVSATSDLDVADASSDAEDDYDDDDDDATPASSDIGGRMNQKLSNANVAPINDEKTADSNKMKSSECGPAETKKRRIGFRDRRIIEYENRIRAYSTPDKVFRYFASLQAKPELDANSENLVTGSFTSLPVFMTPDDFVRSLTPGAKQPDGLGLDQFQRIDPKKFKPKCSNLPEDSSTLPEDSIFFKLAENGLLTFSDYLFLLTMLSTPPRHFELAFKMFDFDGDGNVDVAEFEKVQSILRSRTTVGKRHRDHSNTGSVMKSIQPALTTYFFGQNKDEKLTVGKFIHFQEQLHQEILRIEFHRYDLNPDGTLKEADFADCLLTHACLSDKKIARMKRRVKKAFAKKDDEAEEGGKEGEEKEEEKKNEVENEKPRQGGITFKEFVDFFSFLHTINDVEAALTFYHIAGAPIDKATFAHVARTVAGVQATDHVIDVIFVLFDENQDEHLSHKEFVSVMKERGNRGLQKSRDTGFTNLITAMWNCGKMQAYDKLVYRDDDTRYNRRLRRPYYSR